MLQTYTSLKVSIFRRLAINNVSNGNVKILLNMITHFSVWFFLLLMNKQLETTEKYVLGLISFLTKKNHIESATF